MGNLSGKMRAFLHSVHILMSILKHSNILILRCKKLKSSRLKTSNKIHEQTGFYRENYNSRIEQIAVTFRLEKNTNVAMFIRMSNRRKLSYFSRHNRQSNLRSIRRSPLCRDALRPTRPPECSRPARPPASSARLCSAARTPCG